MRSLWASAATFGACVGLLLWGFGDAAALTPAVVLAAYGWLASRGADHDRAE